MNKKGQFDVARKTMYWMIAGFMITIIILTFAIIMSGYRAKITTVSPELKSEIISSRFIRTPECFAYVDDDGFIHEGVIDLRKFTNEQMMKCYYTNQETGFKDYNFALRISDLEVRTNNFYTNIDHTIKKPILVYDGENIKPEIIAIAVQVNVR